MFAATGDLAAAALANAYLHYPSREFVTSEYVRLEVLPKARWMRQADEIDFYETFFRRTRSVPPSASLLEFAMEEASKIGLNAIDALHVASAVFGGAEEIITTEKSTKPMHRTKLVRVTSILPNGGAPSRTKLGKKRPKSG